MMHGQNLDQAAWDYLTGSARDQVSLRKELINAGAVAVFPLLRAGMRIAQGFGESLLYDDSRRSGMSSLELEEAYVLTGQELAWVHIAESMIEEIY